MNTFEGPQKKENGAHKHCSHRNFRRAQNIHVMLSYAKNNITNKNTNTNLSSMHIATTQVICIFEFQEVTKVQKKKNGAHNHLSQLQKLRASKYSRHVVLCKYNSM